MGLIQIRGGIKALIDYFYKGLNLGNEFHYEKKIYEICEKLREYKDKKYNQYLIKKIITFLNLVNVSLKTNNNLVHDLDINFSVLEQIFKIVDVIKKRFKKTFVENTIKDLIEVRKKYYFNR